MNVSVCKCLPVWWRGCVCVCVLLSVFWVCLYSLPDSIPVKHRGLFLIWTGMSGVRVDYTLHVTLKLGLSQVHVITVSTLLPKSPVNLNHKQTPSSFSFCERRQDWSVSLCVRVCVCLGCWVCVRVCLCEWGGVHIFLLPKCVKWKLAYVSGRVWVWMWVWGCVSVCSFGPVWEFNSRVCMFVQGLSQHLSTLITS